MHKKKKKKDYGAITPYPIGEVQSSFVHHPEGAVESHGDGALEAGGVHAQF